MTTILDHYAILFTRVMDLAEQIGRAQGRGLPLDQVRAELLSQLRASHEAAQQCTPRGRADADEAAFAAVAWMDETLARQQPWKSSQRAFQVDLYSGHNAGEEFFSRLEALSADRDQVREVYYVALCLGFKGKYYYEVDDSGELGRIKDHHARNLPAKPIAAAELRQLLICPQPYVDAKVPPPVIPSRLPEYTIKISALVAAMVVVVVLGYYWMQSREQAKVAEVPQGPSLAAVSELMAGKGCRDIVAEQESTGGLSVRGHAPSESVLQEIGAALRHLDRGNEIHTYVGVLADPHCEVVGLSHASRQRNLAGGRSLRVKVRGGEKLTEGDGIAMDLNIPGDRCLYVDYVAADGSNVVHVYPEPGQNACGTKGGQMLIGDADGRNTNWVVSPPFGQEMVLVLSSAKPLFEPGRHIPESTREYLQALQQALRGAGDDVLADYALIKTVPKQ